MDMNEKVEFTKEGYQKVLDSITVVPADEKEALLQIVASCIVGNPYD